jgi:hypothetical protein
VHQCEKNLSDLKEIVKNKNFDALPQMRTGPPPIKPPKPTEEHKKRLKDELHIRQLKELLKNGEFLQNTNID